MDKAIQNRLIQLGVVKAETKNVSVEEYIYLDVGDIFRDDDEFFDESKWITIKDSGRADFYTGTIATENRLKANFRRKIKSEIVVNKKAEIKCEILSGAWKGEHGIIIGTVPRNGAFIVEFRDMNIAFFGNEIKGV